MSTTGRDLARRLRGLVALGTATTLVLFLAYRGVHGDAVPLSDATTPAVLAVDTARNALYEAHDIVRNSGAGGDTSGEFYTRISVAQQSLAVAASENVMGLEGRHDLQTVTGLIAVYSIWLDRRGREPAGSPLRAAYLQYAERVLGPGTGGDIMSRLADLRAGQVAEARRQASFPWPLWLGWGTVAVLWTLLCAALLETQRFLRHRFRRPVDLRLLGATALCVTGVPTLAWHTVAVHGAMSGALSEIVRPVPAAKVPDTADDVHGALRHAWFWASLSEWVLLGGVVVVALAVWGLWPRIAEYRFRVPR
ncbi:hypothetical protein [Streptomyces sp. NBC_00102]|uniref:hypothetical protein n=1 Tax=Streptomyces sp. NBC_00102 TaxID=2975652 RepID=UPI0022574170|nr:hypothetical protein [Streptomyces sp. NBC_00102]MCX5397211.1 hypothetical protein [Streptomyces sp. NBC_00102]